MISEMEWAGTRFGPGHICHQWQTMTKTNATFMSCFTHLHHCLIDVHACFWLPLLIHKNTKNREKTNPEKSQRVVFWDWKEYALCATYITPLIWFIVIRVFQWMKGFWHPKLICPKQKRQYSYRAALWIQLA